VIGVLVGHPGSHELGLHGPGAAHAPVRRGHFLNHGLLDAIDGSESLQVLVDEDFKAFQ